MKLPVLKARLLLGCGASGLAVNLSAAAFFPGQWSPLSWMLVGMSLMIMLFARSFELFLQTHDIVQRQQAVLNDIMALKAGEIGKQIAEEIKSDFPGARVVVDPPVTRH